MPFRGLYYTLIILLQVMDITIFVFSYFFGRHLAKNLYSLIVWERERLGASSVCLTGLCVWLCVPFWVYVSECVLVFVYISDCPCVPVLVYLSICLTVCSRFCVRLWSSLCPCVRLWAWRVSVSGDISLCSSMCHLCCLIDIPLM